MIAFIIFFNVNKLNQSGKSVLKDTTYSCDFYSDTKTEKMPNKMPAVSFQTLHFILN